MFFSTDENIPKFLYEIDYDPFAPNPTPRDKKSKIGILAGNMQKLAIGMRYNISATLTYNDKYKQWQYTPQVILSSVPKSHKEQIAYLSTQATKLQAENILRVYPNVVSDILAGKELDPSPINGIGQITWQKITKNIIDNYVISYILVLLRPLGISFKMITKLLGEESNPVLLKDKLLDNPYMMTKIHGLGFKRVDEIALKLQPQIKVSLKRVCAYLKYYFQELGENSGDTLISVKSLDNSVSNDIPECMNLYKELKAQELNNGKFLHFTDDGKYVGLNLYYRQEMKVYNLLKELSEIKPTFNIDIEQGIAQAEEQQGFQFTAEQRECLRQCCQNNVFLITGGAGTGKSTILRAITSIYKDYPIACCALSAKAAQRIQETTDHDASTIHRLLEFSPFGFRRNAENPLNEQVIIVDEASMINIPIFLSLLLAIQKGSKVILCGDDGQLPPIGYGNIFHDLLNNDSFVSSKLIKIHRQAAKSGIISDAATIRNNRNPLKKPGSKIVTGDLQDMTYMFRDSREDMRSLAIRLFMKSVETSGLDNTVIITPCKQDRVNSTFEINRIIQDKLFPNPTKSIKMGKKEFRIGDKVIQRSNNYQLNVVNGEIGYITNIYKKDVMYATIDFGSGKILEMNYDELGSIELAYALTIHLCQGSGYDNVICIIDNTHYKLLDSCLLYTGLTRAIKKCLLISEASAFQQCIRHQASNRKTWLNKKVFKSY